MLLRSGVLSLAVLLHCSLCARATYYIDDSNSSITYPSESQHLETPAYDVDYSYTYNGTLTDILCNAQCSFNFSFVGTGVTLYTLQGNLPTNASVIIDSQPPTNHVASESLIGFSYNVSFYDIQKLTNTKHTIQVTVQPPTEFVFDYAEVNDGKGWVAPSPTFGGGSPYVPPLPTYSYHAKIDPPAPLKDNVGFIVGLTIGGIAVLTALIVVLRNCCGGGRQKSSVSNFNQRREERLEEYPHLPLQPIYPEPEFSKAGSGSDYSSIYTSPYDPHTSQYPYGEPTKGAYQQEIYMGDLTEEQRKVIDALHARNAPPLIIAGVLKEMKSNPSFTSPPAYT